MSQLVKTQINNKRTYQEYKELVLELIENKRTSGENQSESLVQNTKMNLKRIQRWDKTIKLNPELVEAAKALEHKYSWTVLVEAWCGDVPHNIPLMAKIAEICPNIELRFILRDENLHIMDQHLTNGGRSIPKLICSHTDTGLHIGTWGPRPKRAQEMVREYKANEAPDADHLDFVKEVQLWYAKDKTKSQQEDFLSLLRDMRERE